MACRIVSLVLLATVCVSAAPALAQDSPASETPAHVSVVDGAAVLERDGTTDSEPLSMPLLAGDRLRTEAGRVEVLFADGSALHLDEHTVVDFQSDEVIRLLEGRIRLSIAGPDRNVSYRVDAPTGWVQVNTPGEYRVSILRNADIELAVLRGAAELVNEAGRSYVRAGERTFAREGSAPTPAYIFNSAAWDSFDRWSEQRRDHRRGISAQYLPNDVRPYAASFDQHGSWRYAQPYGYVWYPRVTVGWRPYYRGRWVSLRPYGWTWIAHDPWGWPTHHYGRWGFSAGAWFWIPGRHWGPAWVSWAYARDYVSWCPLGWNNRPVFQFVNVNVFGGRRWDPWDAWTVVPRGHFGRGYVNVTQVRSVRIDQRIHNTFIVRDSAPEVRYAVGRTAAPIRTAGRFAVPRSGGPPTSASDARGVRESAGAAERRFPSAARPPRTGTAVQPGAAAAPAPSDGARAVLRSGSRSGTSALPRAGSAVETRAHESSGQSRRAPGPSTSPNSEESPSNRSVTIAPPGAVRAVPRGAERSSAAPGDAGSTSSGRSRTTDERRSEFGTPSSQPSDPRAVPAEPRPSFGRSRSSDAPRSQYGSGAPQPAPAPDRRAVPANPGTSFGRSRMSEERRPAYTLPAPQQSPSRPTEDVPRYRSNPMYRSAPESRPEYGGRAVPRSSPPSLPSAPSYRGVPEGRPAPSGPPPPAASPSPSRESQDAAGARSRSRGGEGESSGGARRRR